MVELGSQHAKHRLPIDYVAEGLAYRIEVLFKPGLAGGIENDLWSV